MVTQGHFVESLLAGLAIQLRATRRNEGFEQGGSTGGAGERRGWRDVRALGGNDPVALLRHESKGERPAAHPLL